jgi:hypothetical protein
MRELHGVYISGPSFPRINLKSTAILFDKLHVVGLNSHIDRLRRDAKSSEFFGEMHLLDCEYLLYRRFLSPLAVADKYYKTIDAFDEQVGITPEQAFEIMKDPLAAASNLGLSEDVMMLMGKHGAEIIRRQCLLVRFAACQVEASGSQAVPIGGFAQMKLDKSVRPECNQVLHVASKLFPLPDESCSWEDVFNFKAEMAGKLWNFRRFLRQLGSKNQTENETKDDLEWTLNEYKKAMEIHKLKASNTLLDVFVITPIEILEKLATFRWSEIARNFLSVKKRQVELMEAEMKAPGRECAYIFEAQKRFGSL